MDLHRQIIIKQVGNQFKENMSQENVIRKSFFRVNSKRLFNINFSFCSTGGSYSKDSLAEAFVKFLENESRPRTDDCGHPSLLSMNTPPKNPTGGEEPIRKTSTVQPILLPDAMMQTFTTPRNSSSILKDILNDS